MNKFKVFMATMAAMIVTGFAALAFANTLPVVIPSVTNTQFIEALLISMGGLKGASTLAVIATALQLIFKALGTPMFGSLFNKLEAQVKFIIVGLLSIASLAVAQMVTGVDLVTALLPRIS